MNTNELLDSFVHALLTSEHIVVGPTVRDYLAFGHIRPIRNEAQQTNWYYIFLAQWMDHGDDADMTTVRDLAPQGFEYAPDAGMEDHFMYPRQNGGHDDWATWTFRPDDFAGVILPRVSVVCYNINPQLNVDCFEWRPHEITTVRDDPTVWFDVLHGQYRWVNPGHARMAQRRNLNALGYRQAGAIREAAGPALEPIPNPMPWAAEELPQPQNPIPDFGALPVMDEDIRPPEALPDLVVPVVAEEHRNAIREMLDHMANHNWAALRRAPRIDGADPVEVDPWGADGWGGHRIEEQQPPRRR